MFRSLRLWALYFRSKLRRGNPAHKAAAAEETARARDLAQQIMERERAALDAAGAGDLCDDKIILSIELQFLWGVFRELVQDYPDLPTNGFDRVKLHLIMRLMDAHGYSFEMARNEAISVEELYNNADELFDELASLGQKAFHDSQPGRLLAVVKTLHGLVNTLEWSCNPGAYEAHLIRRHNNPYFPEPRRIVSKGELVEAKRMDDEDYMVCQQRFEELGKEIEALPSTLPVAEFHKLRERLDDLVLFSMGVGGPAKELASKADQIRDALISDIRAAFSDDEQALENIEKADAYHKDNTKRFYIPLMAQMLRENSPIMKEETIPTMLSEDPETISICMNSLPEDDRPLFRVGALQTMGQVLRDGYIDPQFEEKLSALEGQWHFASSQPSDVDEGCGGSSA